MKKNVFGENLKYLRKKHGMSQEEFAERMGYTSKNISKWETGVSNPKFDVAMKIADMFGLKDINELFFEKIDFLDNEVDQDFLFSKEINSDISTDTITLYYLLLKHQDDFQYDYSPEFRLDIIINNLSILSQIGFIDEYKVEPSNDKIFISNKFSDKVLQNKDKSFRNVLKSMSIENIDFSNEKQYQQYIKTLNLTIQVLIVLDFIDSNMDIEFSLTDLYCENLFDRFLENKYINKDFKTIIRTSLTKLCSYGIITRKSRGVYRKKHHTISVVETIDYEKFDSILKLDLNSQYELYKYSYFFSDLLELGYSEKQIVSNIKRYLNDLINMSLMENYIIYIKDQETAKLINDNEIKLNSHINGDIEIEIQT